MANIAITFESDSIELFDTLKEWRNAGGANPLGDVFVSIMMTGEASFRDRIQLKLFGIAIKDTADEIVRLRAEVERLRAEVSASFRV